MKLKAALAALAIAGCSLAAPQIQAPAYAAAPTPGPQAVVDLFAVEHLACRQFGLRAS